MINKKCLVFGANGYIGSHLVHLLIATGNSVTAFGLRPESIVAGVEYRIVDIANPKNLNAISWDVDVVFVFSGLTGTYAGFQRPQEFLMANEMGLLNIIESIANAGFKPRVVFPSTRLVYQGSDIALREDDPFNPKTIYAANKLACEHLLHIYSHNFGIEYTVYRICVPYGNMIGSEYSYGTIGAFISQARMMGIIKIFGDGSLRRTFTHVGDLCNQIINSCMQDASRNETFNISGEDMSLKWVAESIASQFGARLEYVPFPEKDLRIESGHTVFNSTKIQELFPFSPIHTIENWLEGLSDAGH